MCTTRLCWLLLVQTLINFYSIFLCWLLHLWIFNFFFQIFLSWGRKWIRSNRPIGSWTISGTLTALLLSFLDPRLDWVQSKFLSNLEFFLKYLFIIMFKQVLSTIHIVMILMIFIFIITMIIISVIINNAVFVSKCHIVENASIPIIIKVSDVAFQALIFGNMAV